MCLLFFIGLFVVVFCLFVVVVCLFFVFCLFVFSFHYAMFLGSQQFSGIDIQVQFNPLINTDTIGA